MLHHKSRVQMQRQHSRTCQCIRESVQRIEWNDVFNSFLQDDERFSDETFCHSIQATCTICYGNFGARVTLPIAVLIE